MFYNKYIGKDDKEINILKEKFFFEQFDKRGF